MITDEEEKKLLFAKCKRSVQEIKGWKVFIFLPQNFIWRFFVSLTVFINIYLCILKCFYTVDIGEIEYIEFGCDAIYYLDTLLSMFHFAMGRTRKLRHGERRHIVLLMIDFVSILPLKVIYEHLVYNMSVKNPEGGFVYRLNVVLRIYQLPKGFSDIKNSTYKSIAYFLLTLTEALSYILLISHVFSCCFILYFDENQKRRCDNELFECIIENEIVSLAILSQCFYLPISKYPLKEFKILLIVEFIVGFLIVYAYVIPVFILVGLRCLTGFFEYYKKWALINILLKNMDVDDKKFNKETLKYFKFAWTYNGDGIYPEILNLFPLSFKKSIFCDLHWNAFRHSDFLQNLSRGCKRSLSLYVIVKFLHPGKTVIEKKDLKTKFLYLESGMLQIMSEENTNSPVISFSGGTVLGEISFFLPTESVGTLKAAQFSVIHVIDLKDFFRVLLDYPRDVKKLFHKFRARMELARTTYRNKMEINPHFSVEIQTTRERLQNNFGNIKWIKKQYQVLSELRQAEKLKAKRLNKESIQKYERKFQNLNTKLAHTSTNLSLITVWDQQATNYQTVCMKMSFPWVINPESSFLFYWNILILFLLVLTVTLYTPVIGWYSDMPLWFFNISIVVTLMYIIDVLLQLTTGVRINNKVESNFSAIVLHRFSTLSFYLDIFAAFPVQLFIFANEKEHINFFWNLYFVNAMVKTYRLIFIVNSWTYSPTPGTVFRTFLKHLLILSILLCWSAALFNLADIKCIFYECSDNDWYHTLAKHINNTNPVKASFLRAVFLTLDIPQKVMTTDVYPSFLISGFYFIICRFFFYALQAECSATYILEYSHEFEYKRLLQFIEEFMNKNEIVGNVRNRVRKTLTFQWKYDEGNYVTQCRKTFDEISKELYTKIIQKWFLHNLQTSRLFQYEDDDFQTDLCDRTTHLVLPEKSLLLTFSVQPNFFYIIKKGFVQINSFISGDLKMNVSTPIIAREGDVFPVIDAFSQTPAAVSAVAISDCHLLMFDLDDTVSLMMFHGVLKDYVEAVRETNLTALKSAKLGLSVINDTAGFDKKSYKAVFRRIKCLGPVLRFVLKKKAIHSDSKYYQFWEWSRLLLTMLNLISWPIILAFDIYSICKSLIFVFIALDFVFFIDVYIHLHVGYYNKKGIYITHPLSTSLHYLTSSFIPDFLAFAPNFHLLYMIHKKNFDIKWYFFVIHVLLRTFSAYRIVGFLYYLRNLNRLIYQKNIILYFFVIALGMHYYVNFIILMYMKGFIKPSFILPEAIHLKVYKPFQYYVNEVIRTTSFVLRKVNYLPHIQDNDIITASILGTFGILCQINFYSYLILRSMTANKNLTIHRYLMKSFVEYLTAQKISKNAVKSTMQHFEYEWQMHKGYDLKKIFSQFPRTLQEDIMFPLYKKTLKGVASLSKANESFYRALSVEVGKVHLKIESEIIHEQQVQSDIFFIHKGKCVVESSSKVLHKGSIIGDIQMNGIMQNTIKAKTNVQLLKLSSKAFYLIISNYYSMKIAFQSEAAKEGDFIESIYVEKQPSFTTIVSKANSNFETKFIPLEEVEKDKEYSKKKRSIMLLHPESVLVQILELFFVFVAYTTVIFVPIFIIALRFLSTHTLGVVYTLDFFWLIKIIVTAITAYVDPSTGLPVFDGRAVIIRYLGTFDGLIIDILSLLPIELIPLAYFGTLFSVKCCSAMSFCYLNRLLRLPYISSYVFKGKKKLAVNIYREFMGSLMSKFVLLHFCICVDLIYSRKRKYHLKDCYWTSEKSIFKNLLASYFCVIDTFVGGGMYIFKPDRYGELLFKLLVSFCSLMSKAIVLHQALLFMYITFHTKSDKIQKLEHVEKYLSIRSASPVVYYRIKKYYCDLLNTFKEGAEPTFLKASPSSIKRGILRGIYTHHLSNCYLFQNLDNVFLEQLAERLERNIFFPGDYVTEKGDVDHNMYFVHKGEVYCIEEDKRYKALELEVDLYVQGEYFGILQGVLLNYPHKNTFRAKTLADVLVLNYHKWEDMRSAFPEITKIINYRCTQYGSTPQITSLSNKKEIPKRGIKTVKKP